MLLSKYINRKILLLAPAFLLVILSCKKESPACFTVNTVSAGIYDSAYFFNCSVNAYSVMYEFGDGQFSYLMNPSHVYTAPGTYVVKLTTINNGNAGSSVTHNVIIAPSLYTSFVGTYHVTGYSYHWAMNLPSTTDTIEGNYTVTDGGSNALAITQFTNVPYYYAQQADTANDYTFYASNGGGITGGTIIFRRPYNDSIYITLTTSYSPASSTSYHLQGKKNL